MKPQEQQQAKRKLAKRWEQGQIGRERFEDSMFELERTPVGRAECPKCEGTNMFFHEHICGWKCTDCGEVQPTSRVKILESHN